MANVVYCSSNDLFNNNYNSSLATPNSCNPTHLPSSHTGIADLGASSFYFSSSALVANLNPEPSTVCVRVANGLPERSVASATLALVPSLRPAAMQDHIMTSLPHTLIGLGPFANLGYTITFTKTGVFVVDLTDGHCVLKVDGNRPVPGSGTFPSRQPSQALLLCHHMECMKTRSHTEALPISPGHRQPPQVMPSLLPRLSRRRVAPGAAGRVPRTTVCIPAKASMPLAHKAKPALSSTSTVPPRPWPWQPTSPARHLTLAAWTSPASVLWLASTMPALAFQSNRHGLTLSKRETVTPSMA
jgi:hypothetical protein